MIILDIHIFLCMIKMGGIEKIRRKEENESGEKVYFNSKNTNRINVNNKEEQERDIDKELKSLRAELNTLKSDVQSINYLLTKFIDGEDI